jgi:uncharacterized protein YkwD
MMRRLLLICTFIAALIGISWASTGALAQPSTQDFLTYDSGAADDVIALVNEWRLQQGLPPFRVNSTLTAMAMAQVSYIYPKVSSITDESQYHIDAYGRIPPARAAAAPYNWPSYGSNNSNVVIGENAAVGSAKYALTFWKGSSIHTRTALNPNYREVGAAAIKHPYGYVFIMDFGARQGILPTLIDSSGQTLYLSNDCFCAPRTQPLTTSVRLFDADGIPLTQPIPWQNTLPIPLGARAPFTVLYANGNYQYLSKVDPVADILRIPGDSELRGPGATLTNLAVAPTATRTPTKAPPSATSIFAPTSTSTPFVPPFNDFGSSTPTSTPLEPTPTNTSLPPTVGATATAIVNPSLTLLYNDRALVIYNASSSPIDLSNITLVSSSGRIAISAWTAVASFPVSAFPSGHCLAAQAPNAATLPTNACKYIRSSITISASRIFWTKESFTIVRGSTVLATCQPGDGRCDVRFNK